MQTRYPALADDERITLSSPHWSIRAAKAGPGRHAIALYHRDEFVDVLVQTPIYQGMIRDAWHGTGPDGEPWTMAWGRLPAGAGTVDVEFTGRGRTSHRTEPSVLAEVFWFAEAPGRFHRVSASSGELRDVVRPG
ncbi:hypothetical protein [Streptomyces abikoensis]|uniref:Uncharacterized protein n=1 Tax=Streptomyces abikoensis TaxID=97398 RepID=A0ABW7T6W5_9ACTN